MMEFGICDRAGHLVKNHQTFSIAIPNQAFPRDAIVSLDHLLPTSGFYSRPKSVVRVRGLVRKDSRGILSHNPYRTLYSCSKWLVNQGSWERFFLSGKSFHDPNRIAIATEAFIRTSSIVKGAASLPFNLSTQSSALSTQHFAIPLQAGTV